MVDDAVSDRGAAVVPMNDGSGHTFADGARVTTIKPDGTQGETTVFTGPVLVEAWIKTDAEPEAATYSYYTIPGGYVPLLERWSR